MNLRITKKIRRLDKGKTLDNVFKALNDLWRDAVRAYLRAVTENEVIPVDSGMSRASLLPLARLVRLGTEVDAGISAAGAQYKGEPYTTGFGGRKSGFKSRAHGEELGKNAYELVFGSKDRPTLIFEF
jgi:hypothetical protein